MHLYRYIHDFVACHFNKNFCNFANFVLPLPDFPITNDPRILNQFLYNKLNLRQTSTYHSVILTYASFKNNELPYDLQSTRALNKAIREIYTLQQNDPDHNLPVKVDERRLQQNRIKRQQKETERLAKKIEQRKQEQGISTSTIDATQKQTSTATQVLLGGSRFALSLQDILNETIESQVIIEDWIEKKQKRWNRNNKR